MVDSITTQVLVIGSGAGGATTAFELAQAGFEVLVLEEGMKHPISDYGADSASAMKMLYRNRGMTPILGSSTIGFVEGCCLGGSTEINSGLWHRLPSSTISRWKSEYGMKDFSEVTLEPHFEWAEKHLSVGLRTGPLPKNSLVFQRGARALGWHAEEMPRTANNCLDSNKCASGCPRGAKQGVSFYLVPAAENAGATFMTGCRVVHILRNGHTIAGVHAEKNREDGTRETIRIHAKHIFVCAGPTQTPLLLRRSGINGRIGNSLKIHPMLKVSALFDELIDAQNNVLPVIQVKQFQPEFTLAGSYFTPGHLAVLLSGNWDQTYKLMPMYRRMASYNVTVCGTGYGTVREAPLGGGKTILRYELSKLDLYRLGQGLARLSILLLASGAKEVHACIKDFPKITSTAEANKWLVEPVPHCNLALTAVHAFSTCPMGERPDCPADSFGKIFGLENLYVNDASMLPDSPGVNPQAAIMAMARRNTRNFIERCRAV